MRGNTKVTSRYCVGCKSGNKFQKNSMVWGFGDFIMILFTWGVWILLKLGFDFLFNRWRCSDCGDVAPYFNKPRSK